MLYRKMKRQYIEKMAKNATALPAAFHTARYALLSKNSFDELTAPEMACIAELTGCGDIYEPKELEKVLCD